MKNLILSLFLLCIANYSIPSENVTDYFYKDIIKFISDEKLHTNRGLNFTYQAMRYQYGMLPIQDWINVFQVTVFDGINYKRPMLEYIYYNKTWNKPGWGVHAFFITLYTLLLKVTDRFETKNVTYNDFLDKHALYENKDATYDLFLSSCDRYSLDIILSKIPTKRRK